MDSKIIVALIVFLVISCFSIVINVLPKEFSLVERGSADEEVIRYTMVKLELGLKPKIKDALSVIINTYNYTVYNVTFVEPYTGMEWNEEEETWERVRKQKEYVVADKLEPYERIKVNLPTVWSYTDPHAYGWQEIEEIIG